MDTITDNKGMVEELIVPDISDISETDLNQGKIQHVLLLTMSTLWSPQPESRYYYCSGENMDQKEDIIGFGQLEPVPKMLIDQGKVPLLILIMASTAARREVSIELSREGSKEIFCKGPGSAVDFFKMQISDYAEKKGVNVFFKVIEIEDGEDVKQEVSIAKASKEVVKIIRDGYKQNPNQKLYLDMHGGRREDQLIVDAVVNMLHMETIAIEKTYSIAKKPGDKSTQIKDVAASMRIFDFVAGMNEFINYGYGKTLRDYVSPDSGNNWRSMLTQGIAEVAEALSLCQVNEFEKGLDKLSKTIDAEHSPDALFDIFKDNIKNDYGSLLNSPRTLYDEVDWAFRKGFYQQCMAIIEATTPKYVFNELLSNDLADVIFPCENGENTSLENRIERLRSLKERHEKDINFYLKIMFYSSRHKRRAPIRYEDASRKVIFNTSPKSSKNEYDGTMVVFRRVSNFDPSIFEEFGDIWWQLKQCRNRMFHVDEDREPVTMEELNQLIQKYLNRLKALMESKKEIFASAESTEALQSKLCGNMTTRRKPTQSMTNGDATIQKSVGFLKAVVVERTRNSLWVRVTDDFPERSKRTQEHNNADGRIPRYKGNLQQNDTLDVCYLEEDDQGIKFKEV